MGLTHCDHGTSNVHRVQFYAKEKHLHEVLYEYFASFLGDVTGPLGAIVLARARTITYLRECLLAKEYTCGETVYTMQRGDSVCQTPIGAAYTHGQRKMFLVDGDMVLARLVVGNEVNGAEFEKMADELVTKLAPDGSGSSQQSQDGFPTISAYGELVDILCARGQHLVALELEALWNRFLSARKISLLCGYKMDSFRDAEVENIFEQICHSHSAITPTESYSSLPSEEEKLAMIATLQQKATVLRSRLTSHWSNGDGEERMKHREQFIDTLCHELRNPVSGIVGNVELLQVGLNVRQAILHRHQDGHETPDFRLSGADVTILRDQLADDLDSVDAIAACAEHMKTISDDVLSLSKLEGGKVVLERVPFDVKTTVASVLKMFSIQARKKGVQLLHDLPAERLLVLGDPGRLAQVILNLVSNAVKFTCSGAVTVQVRPIAHLRLASSSSVFKISVRDTGRGLSQDEIAILFQRFAQPLSTSFTSDGGTGLGLYISKHLVELMHGKMYVESQKGNGSTFSFTFQAQEANAAEHASWRHLERDRTQKHGNTPLSTSTDSSEPAEPSLPPANSVPRRPKLLRGNSEGSLPHVPASPAATTSRPIPSAFASPSTPEHQPRHILLVDDNNIILRTMTRMLYNSIPSSLTISTATNGYDAISQLITHASSPTPVSLILMDLDMPYMDGLKATRKIRDLDALACSRRVRDGGGIAATPIVGLTADGRAERCTEARGSGMDDCVRKPITKGTLIGLVARYARPAMAGDS